MKSYKTKFKDYLNDLAKRSPSPGGGSAVCLCFCLGISLIEKAINYSHSLNSKDSLIQKKDKALKIISLKLKKLKIKVYPLIDEDSIIFAKIMNSSGAKREQFIKRGQQIVITTAKACEAVFLLANSCESDIKKSISSDFKIGKKLVKDTMFGCVLNLEANSKMFGTSKKDIVIFKKVLKKWQ